MSVAETWFRLILKTGNFVHNHNSKLVAGLYKSRVRRVMRCANKVKARILELLSVALLADIAHRVSDIGVVLQPIGATEFEGLAVNLKSAALLKLILLMPILVLYVSTELLPS